jgi:NADH:ubiquinone oxidoreductase subunit 6 (subunit J)
MSLPQIVFLAVGAVTVAAAIAVVSSRNVLHSAFLLALTFFGVALLYVLLDAPFIAAAQVLVYIGAISVLIVFAIMLSRKVAARDLVQRNEQWLVALVVSVILFGVLGYALLRPGWPVARQPLGVDTIGGLGQAFVGTYALPFEVVSVVLLVALVGAIIIARER